MPSLRSLTVQLHRRSGRQEVHDPMINAQSVPRTSPRRRFISVRGKEVRGSPYRQRVSPARTTMRNNGGQRTIGMGSPGLNGEHRMPTGFAATINPSGVSCKQTRIRDCCSWQSTGDGAHDAASAHCHVLACCGDGRLSSVPCIPSSVTGQQARKTRGGELAVSEGGSRLSVVLALYDEMARLRGPPKSAAPRGRRALRAR